MSISLIDNYVGIDNTLARSYIEGLWAMTQWYTQYATGEVWGFVPMNEMRPTNSGYPLITKVYN